MLRLKLKKNNQRGFTLIEVVMSVFIFAMLAYSTIQLLSNVFTTSSKQSLLLSNADQARKVAFNFVNEIRNALTANDGSFALSQAGDNQIVFFTTAGAATNKVNRIRYFVTGTTLFRGVVVPTGSPLTYNLGTENTAAVQANLANGATPIFYYYDGNYNGSTAALTQPVNVNAVKFVKINLMILNQAGVKNTATNSVTDGAALRSLKNNLGN